MTLEEFARGAIAKVDELHAQLTALKEKNERLLRELSDAHSKIVDLEAGEEKLKARVSELEKENERLQSYYDNLPQGASQ